MLIMDIETAPDLTDSVYVRTKSAKLGDKRKKGENLQSDIQEKVLNEFPLHPLTGIITAVGFLTDGEIQSNIFSDNFEVLNIEPNQVYTNLITLEEYDENTLLTKTWDIISEFIDAGMPIVTYNGKEFDFPFLIRRSMMLGVPRPLNINVDELTSKFSSQQHIDLFQILHTYREIQKFKMIPLNEWAYRMKVIDDLNSGDTGADCISYYFANNFEALRNHLLSDLVKTYLIINKIRGWLYGYTK